MKLLKKVLGLWQSRKTEAQISSANSQLSQSLTANLYGSDDDLGFC